METECKGFQLEFHGLGRRRVEGAFRDESLVSDGGALLLREAELRTGILSRLSDCFVDHRDARLIAHPLDLLLKQRV